MKMYGRATEVAGRIVEAFKHPETLSEALAVTSLAGVCWTGA